jgi:ATP-dependent Zn protease
MKRLSESARRATTAYHEAGHAVAAWSCRVKIHKISIVRDSESDGRMHSVSPLKGIHLDYDGSPQADAKAKNAIIICLAGAAAQRQRSVRR